MRVSKLFKQLSVILLGTLFWGCGENSNSSGVVTLSVNVPVSASVANLAATAKVNPARTSTSLSGIPMTFTAVQYGKDSTGNLVTDPVVSSGEVKTDSTGSYTWNYNFPQKSYLTTIQVSVTVSGVTVTSVVTVAAGS